MNDLRTAAQQALEALEDVDGLITALLGGLLGSPDADAPGAKVQTAIAALRAALEQEQNLRILLRDIRNDEQCFHWQESIDAELGGEP